MLLSKLLIIYVPLMGWTGLGWAVGWLLPRSAPAYVGKFLFWIGVPIGIVAFLRHTPISTDLWIAPIAAWAAVLLGAGLARIWLRYRSSTPQGNWQTSQSRASFVLSSMVGNTGYIGFPVSLGLVGTQYFPWALFYDLLGSTPGAYGLGVAIAARASNQTADWRAPWRALLLNPALWSFGLGVLVREVPIPAIAETALHQLAWCMVSLSLLLVGMRLSQLSTLKNIRPAVISLSIKMVVVPLILGSLLWAMGIRGLVHRAILLEMAMPPAFATLVLAEAYDLDSEMAVTTIAIGSLSLLVTLPLWLWLF